MRFLPALLLIALALPSAADAQSIAQRAQEMNQRSLSGTPTPAPLLGAYLGAVRVEKNSTLGSFLQFTNATFVFLPESEGTAKLYRDGDHVATYDWSTPTSRGPFYNVSPMQLTWPTSEYSMLGYQLEEPGLYEIVYEAGGDPFWRMPFQVSMTGGEDPYNPDPTFRLDGLWNDHAYILHDKEGSGAWDFKLWIHAADFTRSDRYNADAPTTLFVYPEGESTPALLAETGKSFINNGNWNRVDFRLHKRHRYDSAAQRWETLSYTNMDRLLPDGAYRIEPTIGGDLYGTYPVTVRNGTPVPTGNQAPGADPLTRIDGGGAAYWLYRQ
ncbi:MAG: hypothetical protein AAF170_17985 [Bacteroidota bacterium]